VVLTTTRGDLLTISVALAIFFASSGIESLRIGLNRAYGMAEKRYWFVLRLESIAYVLVGAVALLAMAFLIVLGPLLFTTASRFAPALLPFEWDITVARYAVASAALVIALVVAHKWLPAGHRRFAEIAPGIVATLALWLAGGMVFGSYLAEFPNVYVSYYAGLASVMIALVFLYLTASIFVFGGELNAAILRARMKPGEDSAPAFAE
jgi:membrane protein